MIARQVRVYDLDVVVMEGAQRTPTATARWFWVIRPRTQEKYMVERPDGSLQDFLSRSGWADDARTALQVASHYAVQIARARLLPFGTRYLDRLVHYDQLGISTESVEELP